MLNKLEIVAYKNKKKTDTCVHADKPIASVCMLDEEDEY
jgi:hypothetical protein